MKRIVLATGAALLLVTAAAGAWLLSGVDRPDQPYNYRTFSSRAWTETMGKKISYLRPGLPFPKGHRVYDPARGEWVDLASLWQDQPLVLETGSRTCPVYDSKGTTMDDLHRQYAGRARIALLYVREAHPGERVPPHAHLEEKIARAKELPVRRRVYVDDHAGTLHQVLGLHPNAVYIIGTDGLIAHFSLWNNPTEVGASLTALLAAGGETRRLSRLAENTCSLPTGTSITGFFTRMVLNSGPAALRDTVTVMKTLHGAGRPGTGLRRPVCTTTLFSPPSSRTERPPQSPRPVSRAG